MSKRLLALMLIFPLLLSIPALAADATGDKDAAAEPAVVSFGRLAELIRENNPTLQQIRYQQQALEQTDDLNSAADALWTAYVQMSNTKSDIYSAMMAVAGNPDAAPGVLEALQGSYAALTYCATSLSSQFDALKISDETKEKVAIQAEQAEVQLTSAAKALYAGYWSLSRQLESLNQSEALLQDNLKMLRMRFQLGQIAELDLAEAENQLQVLQSSKATLQNELKNLLCQLNLLLGRSYDAPLALAGLPGMSSDFFADRDQEKDLETALAKNFTVRLDKLAQKELTGSGAAYTYQLQAAGLQISADQDRVRFQFSQLSRAIADKEQALASAGQTYRHQQRLYAADQLRFELGQISDLALDQSKSSLDAAYTEFQNANANLLMATESYLDLVAGLSPQS